MTSNKPHIIVVGNEKGGVGKTTTSMHILVYLLYAGYDVATIDIDSRQRSFTDYIENRNKLRLKQKINLPMPVHYVINLSKIDSLNDAVTDEEQRLVACLAKARNNDFIIIDSPGSNTNLARLAHSYADTIITPINDSFIDLSVLAGINQDSLAIDRHGVYSEMIWQAKINKAKRNQGEIDWVILRNRLSNINAKNKVKVASALKSFAKRVRCRLAEGFTERVIYRELYLEGLTLTDVANQKLNYKMNMSHIAARQELKKFIDVLGLETKVQKSNAALDKNDASNISTEEV